MDFNYTDEQNALQDTLRRFISKDYGFEQRRALAKSDAGFSREHWAQFAELGLLALPYPEEFGGMNGNAVDTLLVMEAFGRGLVLEPYLATVIVAGGLIRDAGSDAQKEALLPAIAGGELMMALAHYEPGARYEVSRVDTAAKADGSGWKLSGAKGVVLGGGAADKLLVSARTEKDISLFLVDRKADGVTVRSYMTQDGGRAAEIHFDNVAVGADALVGTKDAALPAIERALDYGIAALCAEAVGIMAALDEATLEYLKTRKQFGQPIGRFQALQHRMVDMVIATEQSRSMATLAAVKADSPDAAERRRALSAAKAYIGQQARFVGQQAVQLHGGMGVVDELNVSHYFKRLTMIDLTFGNTDHHLGLFSDMLLAA
ncbi:MAG: acyl-CoA dehydrogenase family protein [Rhodocyclales bacterium]|nr:acyl-CoA dehydrogenase family protein [Rhodocyclales bacterium]